ncbi:MAG: thymidylate synthase [Alphaproteobacteria bacterium]|nr:thymidylate synthase [Alphaproteobacteria bacterium]
MKAYLDILKNCLENGTKSDNRTGIPTIRIPWGATFEHDMSKGFPLITTKFTPLKTISTELEFFINGFTDKKWLQDRNCKIWNEWASEPSWQPLYEKRLNEARKSGIIVTEAKDKEIKESAMSDTRDLGPVYGWQWRHWNGKYVWNPEKPELNYNLDRPGFDQLKNVINTARKNPNDRRLIVSAWNPVDQPRMALPPCHYCWQILILNNKLNLIWNQRSCDMFLGIPFNIASYAMLLLLLAKELGYEPGVLRGNWGDVHIYENHIDQVKEQLSRTPYELPQVAINNENWNGIFNWHADGGYKYLTKYLRHEQLQGDVAR